MGAIALEPVIPVSMRRKAMAKLARLVIKGGSYLRCLQGAHDNGMRLRFLTTRYWASGDWPELEEVVEGGVGVMVSDFTLSDC